MTKKVSLILFAVLLVLCGAFAVFVLSPGASSSDSTPHAATQMEQINPDGTTTTIPPASEETPENTEFLFALQNQLEEAICAFDGVKDAAVTVADSGEGGLMASVLVTMAEEGAMLSEEQAAAVHQLLKDALGPFCDLTEENISITDTQGNLYLRS